MWRNPIATALAGLLIGFSIGYIVGQGDITTAPSPPAPQAADPHAGVPGAPPMSGAPGMPPEGGRTAATGNPQLLEQARQLEKLIEKDPANYDHLVQMANIQYDLGSFSRAVEFYEKARGIRDDSADVLTDLGVCYRETNRAAQALELFDKAAELKPEHWQSRFNAIVVRLFDLSDPKGAQQELDKLKALRGSVPGIPDLAALEQEIAKRMK